MSLQYFFALERVIFLKQHTIRILEHKTLSRKNQEMLNDLKVNNIDMWPYEKLK